MTRPAKFAVGVLCLLAGVAIARPVIMHFVSKQFLNTGPNGPETPATVGLAFERLQIPSGGRILDSYLVRAPATCQPRVAVLIFHGVMETISEWVPGQKFLYDHCVSSVVFDYSGHGESSRPGTIERVNEDGIPAYAAFAAQFPGERLCVLGHSLGNGPMLEALPRLSPTPSCVVVANAFSSLRDMGRKRGTSIFLLYGIPDVWDNVENVRRVKVPLLVAYSDADAVVPPAMGQRIFDAAPQPKQLAVSRGFPHNALYQKPSEEWWTPVLQFLQAR
ncbi:MAG TPA: alpha/beta fold hydrolase [Candidatus Sulfotelmatobacter sp.]|nr:alpha/beta fold hydrolase [Candidatus Sulfotelmatobacter sp.]